MKKLILPAAISFVAISCHRELRRPDQDNMISIGKKESIHSNVLNEHREFWVYVPPYSINSGKKFSVLYVLDGDAHFHSLSGLVQIMGTGVNGTRVIPEMMVVAIPNTDRNRDLTPTHNELIDGEEQDYLKTSGGGDNFLKFMETELMPYIESRYPTHPYRVLVGHSFGGIAAINALYKKPDLFDAYIAIDPSLWWDHHVLLKEADTVFSTKKFDNKYLFIGQANTLSESNQEHFGAIKEFEKLLSSSKNTSGIKWSYRYYPEDSHGSVAFVSEYDGLRFIFKDFSVSREMFSMGPEKLKANYAQYRMAPPEGLVNSLGYVALVAKDLALAEEYFQMNIEAYPESANAYDSMGELLLSKGDTVQALKSYERSLELDGNNQKARTVIKELLARKK